MVKSSIETTGEFYSGAWPLRLVCEVAKSPQNQVIFASPSIYFLQGFCGKLR
jgi:hypothetical protein